MNVDADNYGALVILRLSGPVAPTDVKALIDDLSVSCAEAADIVVDASQAELSAATATPLFALRDQQRYLKPRVTIASPSLDLADASTLLELLPALETSHTVQAGKLLGSRIALTKLKARAADVETAVRRALGLGEGFSQEDYDLARAEALIRHQKAKLLATTSSAQVEALRRSIPATTPDAEVDKRAADARARAYSATRGD